MDWQSFVKGINAEAAQAFVTAARHVIDALLIEAERQRQVQTPPSRDYNATAGLPRTDPPGGWLAHEDLRQTVRDMAEAIAAEKWTDGVVATLKVIVLLGGVA